MLFAAVLLGIAIGVSLAVWDRHRQPRLVDPRTTHPGTTRRAA